MPSVDLVSSNNLSITMLAHIARVCTTPLDKFVFAPSNRDKDIALFKSLYTKGHWSVFEHASMTFLVSCSRACSLQLARHRHISRTEMSQRYTKLPVDYTGFEPNSYFQVSDSLRQNAKFVDTLETVVNTYHEMLREGIKPEDARMILPEATTTRMFITLNLRTLLELTQKRAANKYAQWEIRELVKRMWKDIPQDMKDVFRPELTWLDNETTDSTN